MDNTTKATLRRRARVAGVEPDGTIRVSVDYRLETDGPVNVDAVRQQLPDGWDGSALDDSWQVNGSAATSQTDTTVDGVLEFGLRLKARADAPPLPPIDLKTDQSVERPEALPVPPADDPAATPAPDTATDAAPAPAAGPATTQADDVAPLTFTSAPDPSQSPPAAAPPTAPVELVSLESDEPRHAHVEVVNLSGRPLELVGLALDGPAPNDKVRVDRVGAEERRLVRLSATGPGPISVSVGIATSGGDRLDVSGVEPVSVVAAPPAQQAAPPTAAPPSTGPSDPDFAEADSFDFTSMGGGPVAAPPAEDSGPYIPEQFRPNDAPVGVGMSLAPRPGDTSKAKGGVDVTAVGIVEGSGVADVGETVEIGAVVGNDAGYDYQQVVVVAHVPGAVTVRDDRWEPHDRDSYRTVLTAGLPADHEVTVPLRIRIDRGGDLNVWFEII